MPSYDFKCPKCEMVRVVVRSIHDDKDVHCVLCQVVMVQLVSVPNLTFRGSGWAGKDK